MTKIVLSTLLFFDEFDNFAILGCINQNYKEDMTENLSESQVESEDEVVSEMQD